MSIVLRVLSPIVGRTVASSKKAEKHDSPLFLAVTVKNRTPVAQLVKRRAVTREVVSSTPDHHSGS